MSLENCTPRRLGVQRIFVNRYAGIFVKLRGKI
ncbi:MAG: hypothetical protein AEth_02041 [Candidatus Argoarchaeum ethanivorans]|uniref:Uncharacterized protein n=1 Tax=Candidatus Argoarchaeum ethanivorans TaxID=2608793 RepID=A0A8B3RXL1_9EURY|nr:MAG: hypothetical protein AEth_02041 [Candidatus Argoarchaeum ethanivorans]